MVYSPKPRSDVFCFKLNFKISKLGYFKYHKALLISILLKSLKAAPKRYVLRRNLRKY